ncbi:ATP-binding cassette domain-containing protein [Kitasatospora sp. NPDC097691]|uniref:ABC transporter ATP-binding protein n=1 Tax=Kitasatospora sp. NPDC097691 TaxID=3157231 RepID=UPI00331A3FFE
MTAPAVHTDDLVKLYGGTPAVSGLDLTVEAGTIFGFLGPNGAGKSTTIGMLCTMLRPSAGRATVAGYDVAEQPEEVRNRIGLVFQESTLDLDLSAEENLRFYAELFGASPRQSKPVIAALLDLVDLTDRKGTAVRDFSGGMRRRLEIARGLLNTPQVLFLDEPTTGLDPQTRVAVWEHLRRIRREWNTSVFLTTHHLEEAEYCDRIAIIDHGRIVAQGTPAELKAVVSDDTVLLRTGDDAAAATAVRERFGLTAEAGPDGVLVRVADGASFVPRFCTEIEVPVHSVSVKPPSLDDVFLHYTGRSIRDTDSGRATMGDIGRRDV